ncbi:protein of unknown function [Cupriavidus taiwanensis]|nr:protein of unknown function [Cupriavidus taiwanensis]
MRRCATPKSHHVKRAFSERAKAASAHPRFGGFVTFPLKTSAPCAVNPNSPSFPKQHPIPPPFRANGNPTPLR